VLGIVVVGNKVTGQIRRAVADFCHGEHTSSFVVNRHGGRRGEE
jgi:hypothetical protein